MHLLYVDESGSDDMKGEDDHFVLEGISVFERVPYHLSGDVENIQQRFFPTVSDPIEFRASAIFNGNGEPWNSMPRSARMEIMREIYRLLARDTRGEGATLFGVSFHKPDYPGISPIQKTCEELAGHFDAYLYGLEISSKENNKDVA